ncbi:DUF397 domain-containing protein [Actinomadura craniellae]|uniref:DUF397 domain-containing protein n=1 Tax=Actinomadura craniellae TaxID=2231787 RepID=A0A365H420_9ACTN|nr:DUF397 domain-containing protein [Actinomadura craniellae]RAY12973.1 DUF397 domain-containing protein [Actinomadura craniellae]
MNTPEWRKSSRSGGIENSDCVELARLPNVIGIRDSKAPQDGYLSLSPESFAHLIARLKRDESST